MPKVGDLIVETELVRTVTPPGPDWDAIGWFIVLPLLTAAVFALEKLGVFP